MISIDVNHLLNKATDYLCNRYTSFQKHVPFLISGFFYFLIFHDHDSQFNGYVGGEIKIQENLKYS